MNDRILELELNIDLMQRKLGEQKQLIEAQKEHIAILKGMVEVREGYQHGKPLQGFIGWLRGVKL